MMTRFCLTIIYVCLTSTYMVLGQELRHGDLVQSQKALLLRSRERLLSKVQKRALASQPRNLQEEMMVCGVCPTPTDIALNQTLLNDISEYISSGEGNTTEILNKVIKDMDKSYASKSVLSL
jgi:hypothetical protein